MKQLRNLFLASLALVTGITSASAQNTAFSYQGHLVENGAPFTGTAEFKFTLWDALTGGNQVAATTPAGLSAPVTNGLFTASVDFGASSFPGTERWLQIEARTSLGSFTTLTPRQKVTPTPYALRALSVQPGGLASGDYGNAVTLSNAANQFSGAFTGGGGGLTGLNASELVTGTVPPAALGNAWQIGGNTGTAPGANFLGTTDDQPLELRVNNQRALRLEASGATVNLLVGPTVNSIFSNVTSAGVLSGVGNRIRTNSSASVIAGGSGNTISNASGGTISGGVGNIANGFTATVGGGSGNSALRDRSTVAGGTGNLANGDSSFIGGGVNNSAGNGRSAVVGGNRNLNNGPHGFLGAGQSNTVFGSAATLSGGENNNIQGGGSYATIPGGRNNIAAASDSFAAGRRAYAGHTGAFVWADSTDADFASTIANQFSVRASGGVRLETSGAGLAVDGQPVVAGAVGTGQLAAGAVTSEKIADGTITAADIDGAGFNATFWRATGNAGTSPGAQFLGTTDNQPLEFKVNGARALRIEDNGDSSDSGTTPDGAPNLIAGSLRNFAGAGVVGATIAGGGATNHNGSAYTNSVLANFGVVGGGIVNTIEANSGFSVIGGGIGNTIAAGSENATIAGGWGNSIGTNSDNSVIGGGFNNKIAANARYATIPGGDSNIATNSAFAAGQRANANHRGAFVWADTQPGIFPSTTDDQFRVRSRGGMEVLGGTTVEAFKFSGSRSGGFPTPVGYAENNNTVGNSAPTLRLVGKGGVSQDGVLSVSTLGMGNIASFGNASVFVSWLTTNGTWNALAFNPTSDRAAKENFTPVNPQEVLDKVIAMPIARWNYKAAPGLDHVGPVAQDFHASFGLNGTDDKHIATVDADGVALAAIQGLNEKVEAQNAEIAELKRTLEKLKQVVDNLPSTHDQP